MVTVGVHTNIFRIFDSAIPGSRNPDEKWFDNDIEVLTSDTLKGTTIVIDFAFDTTSVIEYTLGGDASGTYVEFNEGIAAQGGQSRYIRVESGDKLNFRAKAAGNLTRAVIGEV